jgi:hypothetical protein
MTKPPEITDLDDARFLKRAGLPLDLPLTHREFSREYSEHWLGLMNAHSRFTIAVLEYSEGARSGSSGKWKLVKRRFGDVRKAMRDCDAFVSKLSGNVMPPVFESEQDEHECSLLSYFLADRAMPFVEYWQSAIAAVDGGTSLTIEPRDMPKWIDEEA